MLLDGSRSPIATGLMFLTGGDNEWACYDRSTAYTGLWFLHAMICENWVDNYFTCLFLFFLCLRQVDHCLALRWRLWGFLWHVKMEFLPPLPHLSTMDYKKGFAYFAADWGTLLFPNALGGYFELYGFLYDTIMQVIKDRFAAQRNSGWFTF